MTSAIEKVKIKLEKTFGNIKTASNNSPNTEILELNSKKNQVDIVGQEKTPDAYIGIVNEENKSTISYLKEGSGNKTVTIGIKEKVKSFKYDEASNCINLTLENGENKIIDIVDMEAAIKVGKINGFEPIIYPKPPGEVTVEMLENCKSRQEYINLVMPWYEYYCKIFGLKWPGALALQGIYETGVPDQISDSLRLDNNLGGLRMYEGTYLPKVEGPGSNPPASEGPEPYCKFKNISDYMCAHAYNIATGDGAYKTAREANTLEEYIKTLVSVWTDGEPESDYSSYIIEDYYKYELEKYEPNK